jgi:hypothetical protein
MPGFSCILYSTRWNLAILFHYPLSHTAQLVPVVWQFWQQKWWHTIAPGWWTSTITVLPMALHRKFTTGALSTVCEQTPTCFAGSFMSSSFSKFIYIWHYWRWFISRIMLCEFVMFKSLLGCQDLGLHAFLCNLIHTPVESRIVLKV